MFDGDAKPDGPGVAGTLYLKVTSDSDGTTPGVQHKSGRIPALMASAGEDRNTMYIGTPLW